MTEVEREAIAKKNDRMRQTLDGCKVVLTEAVRMLPTITRALLMLRVKDYNDFSDGNNPHGERDFGKIRLEGVDYFWKFDYYDGDYKYFELDGNRVLTIMRADEY